MIQKYPPVPTVYTNGNTITLADVLAGAASYSSTGGTLNMPSAATLYGALQAMNCASTGFTLDFRTIASDTSASIGLAMDSGYTITGLTAFNYWADLKIVATGAATNFRVYMLTR